MTVRVNHNFCEVAGVTVGRSTEHGAAGPESMNVNGLLHRREQTGCKPTLSYPSRIF